VLEAWKAHYVITKSRRNLPHTNGDCSRKCLWILWLRLILNIIYELIVSWCTLLSFIRSLSVSIFLSHKYCWISLLEFELKQLLSHVINCFVVDVQLLGRMINLRSLITERINKIFRENIEFLFDRFECQDLCAIVVSDFTFTNFFACNYEFFILFFQYSSN